jgi:hypothetical protein
MKRKTDAEVEEEARANIRRRQTAHTVASSTISRPEFWELIRTVAERPDLQNALNHLYVIGKNDADNRRLVRYFDLLLTMFMERYNDVEAYSATMAAEVDAIGSVLLQGTPNERREAWVRFDTLTASIDAEALQREIRWLRWQEEHPEEMGRAS